MTPVIWILILVIKTGSGAGITTSSTEFFYQDRCERAAQIMQKSNANVTVAICVQK